MKVYQCFEIIIKDNKAAQNMDKCTQYLFEIFKYSPKHKQNKQRYQFCDDF